MKSTANRTAHKGRTATTQGTAPSERAAVVRSRKGPHWDLSASCRFLGEDIIDFFNDEPKIGELLLTLSNAARVMLESAQTKKRLDAARDILLLEPDCGIAHAVLAREGATTPDEQEMHYRRAVDFMLWELLQSSDYIPADEIDHDSNSLGSYLLREDAAYVIASEFAEMLWKDGRRDEAIDIIARASELDDVINMAFVQQVSWLLQCDRDDDAALVLNGRRADDGFWHYMNALLQFKKLGSTPVSRAAVIVALHYDDLISCFLLEDNVNLSKFSNQLKTEAERELFEFRIAESREFADSLRCAWHHVPGSFKWLDAMRRWYSQRFFGKRDTNAANEDKAREKRWLENIELSDKFIDREQFKDAKNCLRMALRDAERMPIEGHHFATTLTRLTEYNNILGESNADLAKTINERVRAIESSFAGSPDRCARSILAMAPVIQAVSEDNDDMLLTLRKVALLVDDFASSGSDDANLYDQADVLETLAVALGKQRNYEEAEALFARAIALHEEYHGKDHPYFLQALDHRARCLHNLGRHEEERGVRASISICRSQDARMDEPRRGRGDTNADADTEFDEHRHHGKSCVWYVDGYCR